MRVTWRILFPKKPSQKFLDAIQQMQKEGWEKQFDMECPDDKKSH
jgi:hypothetical protein